MYQIGEQVLYGIHGLCTVTGTEERTVDRKKVVYYVLEPAEQVGARFYVPMHNPAALSKIRRMISREALDELLRSDEVRADAWIADENSRKQRYRELIGSGDLTELIRMVHALHLHRERQQEAGKKIHMCDENFLRDAEKMLSGEFSVVLQMDAAEVGSYIHDMMMG